MKRAKTLAGLTALPLVSLGVQAENGDTVPYKKPNILFILADDMCYELIGAAGYTNVITPNLDKLMHGGVTFTHAYNMGSWSPAVCMASRTMLNTGLFGLKARRDGRQHPIWAQLMKAAGYKTYFTGKWHVPIRKPPPFDVVKHVRPGMPNQTPEGYKRPKSKEDYEKGWKPWDKSKGGFWEGGKHWTDVTADDAISFIEDAKSADKPFFMYIAFNATHDPRQSPKKYVDMYPLDKIKVPKNFIPEYPYADKIGSGRHLRDEKLLPFPRTEYAVKVNRQEYYACATYLDYHIGRVLEALKKSGMADNTYIFFTADQGLSVGHHGFAGKQNMYEESLRPPLMIDGPGIKPGMKIDTPVYLQDVMPTILELAGTKPPEWVEFKSLLPLLKDPSTPHYDAIYGYYLNYQRMALKDGWKLIAYPYAGKYRLYNLRKDPHEMTDLADNPEYAAKLEEMKKVLHGLQAGMDDHLDIDNPPPRKKKSKKKKRKKPKQ